MCLGAPSSCLVRLALEQPVRTLDLDERHVTRLPTLQLTRDRAVLPIMRTKAQPALQVGVVKVKWRDLAT